MFTTYHRFLYVFTDPELPPEEIWIISNGKGDMPEALAVLQQLESQAHRIQNQPLYMHRRFVVSGFMCPPISMNNNPLTRLTNATVKALNEREKFPIHIIMLTDELLVNYVPDLPDSVVMWALTEMLSKLLAKVDATPKINSPHHTPYYNHTSNGNPGT